jgi:hypothetical protein
MCKRKIKNKIDILTMKQLKLGGHDDGSVRRKRKESFVV